MQKEKDIVKQKVINKQALVKVIQSFQHFPPQLYYKSLKICICHFDMPFKLKGSIFLCTAIHMGEKKFSPGLHVIAGVKRGDVCIEIVGHSDSPYPSVCLFSCCRKPPIVLISSNNIHTITVATILTTSTMFVSKGNTM